MTAPKHKDGLGELEESNELISPIEGNRRNIIIESEKLKPGKDVQR